LAESFERESAQGCHDSFVLRENQTRHTIELALRALCYFGKRVINKVLLILAPDAEDEVYFFA
jgi:hypothetical protein